MNHWYLCDWSWDSN